jgi:hypothetical protein
MSSLGTITNDVSDYVFFASYVQPAPAEGEAIWSNTDEMGKMNGGLSKKLNLMERD